MSHARTVAQLINHPRHLCIHHLLKSQAEHTPGAPAILALGRAPLTYRRLHKHIDGVVQMLHTMGLGRNDRVALVLPNGPEMAVAFLAVATTATCAPLNPACSTNEFDFYLADLHAKALIVQSGMDSPVRDVARARGLRIIELSPVIEAEAGVFTLTGEKHAPIARHGLAQPDDVALVLPTSGTTSRPKIVPLTHTNVCTAAHNMGVILEIFESDRCLNVLPLFYAHALLTSLLTSLVAGASIVCTPGFSVPEFFAWMAEFRPTWYSAVPAIHQEILARITLHREIIARCPLRLIRSGGASLSPLLMAELERVLNVPVIDSCGMTEVSGLVTCNPLPPRERKAGSVGVAAGPEVAIMDDVGTLRPAGGSGEIVVRGPSVFQGYDNNPTANGSAFMHGWFRTGDQGYLDSDGYLFITGRLKEIINRGGEKISPREVEEVLMEHPAVAEVAAFAIPHAELGEDVAVAIVLRENASATQREIRKFAEVRLADFKVPRQVVFIDEIPKGATGKVQRNSLATKLGLPTPNQTKPVLEEAFVVPRTPVELLIAKIWQDVLGLDRVSVYDNFFDLGGHSLLAMQVIASVEKHTGLRLHLNDLTYQTLGQLAAACEERTPLPHPSKSNFLQKIWHALEERFAK
jgi:acyl-CoA synthetase (AMP-forming)/AMP-acid ligase II/acyl carrier protein